MARHKRSFHVHAHQSSENPGEIRWSITRTLWAPLQAARSAEFARGSLEIDVDGGTPHWTALTVLELVLAQYRAQLEAAHPEDRV